MEPSSNFAGRRDAFAYWILKSERQLESERMFSAETSMKESCFTPFAA